jgi:hypothetical protein
LGPNFLYFVNSHAVVHFWMVMRFKHDLARPECTKMLLDHGGSPKDIVNSTCK